VCYRAGNAPALLQRQGEMLDPVLAWAKAHFGVELNVTDGVMPVSQPAANRARLKDKMNEYDHWKFAALTAGAKPLGSLILALALIEGRIDAATAFDLSHLEEAYETDKWGADEEKEKRLKRLKEEISCVEEFLMLLMSRKN
jgi:chaperone required for assembly of F1-ATPase